MELNKLIKVKNKREAKRIGRGESSGKGKTSGKGYKGQKVRGKVRLGFEGGQLPLIKRLPFRRGVGNNLAAETLTITLEQISVFASGETIDKKALIKSGLLRKSKRPVHIKLVAKGEINKPLTIHISTSAKAKELIEKAKGKVVSASSKETEKDA